MQRSQKRKIVPMRIQESGLTEMMTSRKKSGNQVEWRVPKSLKPSYAFNIKVLFIFSYVSKTQKQIKPLKFVNTLRLMLKVSETSMFLSFQWQYHLRPPKTLFFNIQTLILSGPAGCKHPYHLISTFKNLKKKI